MQLDAETISTIIAASSVIIGVIFSVMSIFMNTKNATRSRQARLFMDFNSAISEREFFDSFFQILTKWQWKDATDFDAKYGPVRNPDDYNTFIRVGMQFDSLGTLVRNKLTDIKFMPRGVAFMVTSFWNKYSPIASQLETMWGNAGVFEEIKYLYDETMKASP